MKPRTIITLAFLSLLAACAGDDGERQILGAVKRDSAPYCSRSKDGCEFSVVKTPDGWGAMVFPITRAENGERVYIPGIFKSYSYDEHGNLLHVTPGL